jgi:predicted transposase/invertase (TIGR01784 family)
MLLGEWRYEDWVAVREHEAQEEGWKRGLEKGLEKGKKETARNALREGFSVEAVQRITGLDTRTITGLSFK